MSDRYEELDAVLDGESWDYLVENYPLLALSVQKAVDKGVKPEEIKRRVVERIGAHRLPLAQRCESAARWLWGQKGK